MGQLDRRNGESRPADGSRKGQLDPPADSIKQPLAVAPPAPFYVCAVYPFTGEVPPSTGARWRVGRAMLALELELAAFALDEPRALEYAGTLALIRDRLARHYFEPAAPILEEHGFAEAA